MIIIETCPKCGGDLRDEVIAVYPPIPRKSCPQCGWFWEGEREQVMRVPFMEPDKVQTVYKPYSWGRVPIACEHCSNHPKNGGSGFCNCTLGMRTATC